MPATVHFDYQGVSVLVIGGNSGIGEAAALAFARAGANVAVGDLPAYSGTGVEERLTAAGARDAMFVPIDVTIEDQVSEGVECVARRFGRIDVAVNNAGIEGPFGSLDELTSQDFDRLISVNLRGTWLGMKYQIRHMARSGGGSIVNTTSTAGIRAISHVGAYSASKHGIIGLTRAAALEQAAHGIRVNAVAPGPVDTGLLERMVAGHVPIDAIAAQVPLQRISQPNEIAGMFLWLASEAASFVTGEVVLVDGGMTIA